MKRLLVVFAIFAAALAVGGTANGAPIVELGATTTMDVSANLVPTCTVSTAPLTFGNVNGLTIVTATGSITINCAQGANYYIAIDGGLHYTPWIRQVSDASSNMFWYDLFKDAAMTTFWGDSDVGGTLPWTSKGPTAGNGTDQAHSVYGRTIGTRGLPTGTYTDTVNVSIYF